MASESENAAALAATAARNNISQSADHVRSRGTVHNIPSIKGEPANESLLTNANHSRGSAVDTLSYRYDAVGRHIDQAIYRKIQMVVIGLRWRV